MPLPIMSDSSKCGKTLATKRGVALSALDERPHRPVKRRASKACQCCRSRKVRCNVIEHGAPCTNCRLDQIDCVITESKRKRKSISRLDVEPVQLGVHTNFGPKKKQEAPWTPPSAQPVFDLSPGEHMPHNLYRCHDTISPIIEQFARPSITSMDSDSIPPKWTVPFTFHPTMPAYPTAPYTPPSVPDSDPVPDFFRPTPPRIDPEAASFLQSKGALAIPEPELRNALLQSYAEFVDPSMPILELGSFLTTVQQADGALGKVSLLVFQAVMYAGSSFVDLACLRRAGFSSRQQARRCLYQKARLLYDHDYETDRISVIQALLLFTYWYEAPDDPKDTWHWMGIACSVAQSIGMNRDPRRSNLDPQRQRLWKRIWWSCVVRDRLIAIGMRRPIRIKEDEHDVPMLALTDFSLTSIKTHLSTWGGECKVTQSPDLRRSLALIFIQQARLCHCIGNVIATQYSSPSSTMSEEGKATVMKLLPKKQDPEAPEIRKCNDELAEWVRDLPEEVQLPALQEHAPPAPRETAPLILTRCLLHMVYYMTLSALHRPHATSAGTIFAKQDADTGAPKTPEGHIRLAAFKITDILQHLHRNCCTRYLPTTGVTVIQPAIINHLLDVNSENIQIRTEGLRGFCECYQVLSRLRDIYPGAEYSIMIVDAAVKRAELDSSTWFGGEKTAAGRITSAEGLVATGLRMHAVAPVRRFNEDNNDNTYFRNTTRHDSPTSDGSDGTNSHSHSHTNSSPSTDATSLDNESSLARQLGMFLATTPPASEEEYKDYAPCVTTVRDLDRDFENLINVDGLADALTLGDGGLMSMQGESSGFMFDMDFVAGGGGLGGKGERDALYMEEVC